MLGSFSQNVDH